MTTDTPRTDACPHCGEQGATIRSTHNGKEWFYDCGTHIEASESFRSLACSRISEIRELKAQVKVAENYKALNDSAFNAVMNELAASQAEVERLRSQLNRAVEIAEMFSQVKGLHHQCNCAMCQKLAALKEEIK
jgi:hypothetical protein